MNEAPSRAIAHRTGRRPSLNPGAPAVSLVAALALAVGACSRADGPDRTAQEPATLQESAPPPVAEQPATSMQRDRTLCTGEERIILTCTSERAAKLVSLCASPDLDAARGYLQYRFGRPGAVELEFPADRRHPAGIFEYSRYTRPLVTYLSLQFQSGGYRYELRQESNAEEEPPEQESVLSVYENPSGAADAPLAEHRCREPVRGTLMDLEEVLPSSTGEPPQ